MMLYIKLIIKLDKTDKYTLILIVIEVMKDINRPVCVQIWHFLKLPFKSSINGRKLAVGGVNKTQFSCYLYTRGYHKSYELPRRMPGFFLIILLILSINSL